MALNITIFECKYMKTSISLYNRIGFFEQTIFKWRMVKKFLYRLRLQLPTLFRAAAQRYKENPFHQSIGYQCHQAPGQIDFSSTFSPTFANAFNEEGSRCVRKRT
jgi:hypothetical protein